MNMKYIIYFDMDGVLVDYPDTGKPDSFVDLPPIAGAVEFFRECCANENYLVLIASTAPWSNPQAWTDKRLWVEQHIGECATKSLILTHHKELLQGAVLIDDRPANGAKYFSGNWFQFDKDKTSWDDVRNFIEEKYNDMIENLGYGYS